MHTLFCARKSTLRRDGAREPQLKFFQTSAARPGGSDCWEQSANRAHSPSYEGRGGA